MLTKLYGLFSPAPIEERPPQSFQWEQNLDNLETPGKKMPLI